jgi:hypothetical protein
MVDEHPMNSAPGAGGGEQAAIGAEVQSEGAPQTTRATWNSSPNVCYHGA